MRIVYIHQHFMTNLGKAGTRSYDVSRHMAENGHEVHMICGIYYTSGLKPMPWYKFFRQEKMDGFYVTVCNVPYSNYYGPLIRMIAFWYFVLLATIAALRVSKPDVIFATSTPLTVGIPGYIASVFKRVPFVFEVRDLWPEAFVIAGELKPGLFVWLLQKLEEFLYAKAKKILLVSPGFEIRLKERGYPSEKLRTILLGADGELFRDAKPDADFRRKYNLENKMVAIFTGAHGFSNGLDYVLEAAKYLKNRDDIRIVLLGDGHEKPKLQEKAKTEAINNVLFLEAVTKTEMIGIVTACDVGLMILLHVGRPRPVTPNKIFDYMFAGLPGIVNFPGCTLDMVKQDGTGVGSDPDNPKDLAEKLVYFADNPDKRISMGKKAREVAYEKYSRKMIAKQITQTFEEVIKECKNQKN